MTGLSDSNLTERMLRERIIAVTGIIRERFPALYTNLMEAPMPHPEEMAQPRISDLCDHLDSLNRQLDTLEQAQLAAR